MRSITASIVGLLIGLTITAACSMGGKAYKVPERKPQDKMWRPCQDFETKDPIGKLCNRVCTKRLGKKCKEWKINIKDFSKEEDFLWFRAGAFVMIDEDQVL